MEKAEENSEKAEESWWPEPKDRRVEHTRRRRLSENHTNPQKLPATLMRVGRMLHALWNPNHTPTRVSHAPASKIYSRAREGHAPSSDDRTNKLMQAKSSGATQEHSGLARFRLRLPEDERSKF
jgi:hypothetical protein